MSFDREKYQTYVSILKEELIPAVGCTEPACLALAGAKLRDVLEAVPDSVVVRLSANLIKNAKSVFIPYSEGLKGIPAAIWLGILGGNSELGLAVLSSVQPEHIAAAKELLAEPTRCRVELLDTPAKLHLIVEGWGQGRTAVVEIMHSHTNFVRIERSGQPLLDTATDPQAQEVRVDRFQLNIRDIVAFAECVDLADVEPILRPQIELNTAIAEQGLAGDYGTGVGRHLLQHFGRDVHNLARATAAAASDARMGGCQMPVVINSGSGNQGITASIPVIVYARHQGLPEERLLRALCVSNLIAIHQKTGVGRLSAYCGAVGAACGAGAALTYLAGGSLEQVGATITNTLANISGMICDGAKASCAAKISSAVDAAFLAHTLALGNRQFSAGDGIVKGDVEETIAVVRDIASEGMRQTDLTVLKHMLDS